MGSIYDYEWLSDMGEGGTAFQIYALPLNYLVSPQPFQRRSGKAALCGALIVLTYTIGPQLTN